MLKAALSIRVSILTITLGALALAGPTGALAADTAASPAQPAAAKVTASLQGIETSLNLLEADVGRSEHRDATPPPFFMTKVHHMDQEIEELLGHLAGLHWTIVNPILHRATALRGRLKELEARLEHWQPQLPPDPNRPLKTSAATGTGAISGTLTDEATGDPIPYTRVEVYCPDPYFDAETMTDVNGVYTMGGLGTGDCYVRTWNQLNFADELYDNIPLTTWWDWSDGTLVSVVDGQTTTGIDFALVRLGEIRGALTDAQDGTPLRGAYMLFFDDTGNNVALASTDNDGHYSVLLPAGDYYVMTNVVSDYHVNEVYDNLPCNTEVCDPTVGDLVGVASGQITAGIDFALDRPGTISGTVTDAETGEPSIPNAWFQIYDASGNFILSDYGGDDADGYTIGGLAAGSYFVRASDGSHLAELYDGILCLDPCDPTTGTPVAVTVATDTPGIDFALEPYSTIAGTVTDSISGLPIQGASISFFNEFGMYVGGTSADSFGEYTGGGLVPGTYFAQAEESDHVAELYQDISCPFSNCDPTGGTPIVLTLGAGATGIDFALDPYSHIAGTVTSTGGAPLPNIDIRIYDGSGTPLYDGWTDDQGSFFFPSIPADSFFIMANPFGSTWVPQLYNGIDCPTGCDPISGDPVVTTPGNTTSISFSLTQKGRIQGRVTDDATGQPVANVEVELYDSTGSPLDITFTWTDGTYQFSSLGTGTYRTVATHPAYIDELYDDIPCEGGCNVNSGTPIGVTIGSDTTGIDFALSRMGSISGTVAAAPDQRNLYAHVAVYDSAGSFVTGGYTSQATGQYTIVGLIPGTYYVTTDTTIYYGSYYRDELYDDIPCDGSCDVTTGTPVVVTDGQDTGGIDFVLDPAPVFSDVPLGSWAYYQIEALYHSGVTAGCASDPLRYCPASPVSRGQMAVFLLASKEGSNYTPPPAVGIFSDVPATDPLAPWIEELAARGVTAGCGGGNFCPGDPVTRRQMAVFLLSTLEGPLYTPPPAVGLFDDVPASDPFAPWIEELANRGITAGCGGGNFCPGDTVLRDQMAVFLVTTFGLQ